MPIADLQENEPAIATDDQSLWFKNGSGIKKITDVVLVDSYSTLEQRDKKEGKLYITTDNNSIYHYNDGQIKLIQSEENTRKSTSELRIELRESDPTDPEDGRIWLRTDS